MDPTKTFLPGDVKILRGPTDPGVGTRISVGGDPEIGYYCTYRGSRMACIAALSRAMHALEAMDFDPPIDPQLKPIT